MSMRIDARPALAALVLALTACNGGGSGGDGDDAADRRAPIQSQAFLDGCATGGTRQTPLPEAPLAVAFMADPLGPIRDVTGCWERFQPAAEFCIPLTATDFTPGGVGPTVDGGEPACAFSGFGPGDDGLKRIALDKPPLCEGCRRLFIDYSRIPEDGPARNYAKGHAYLMLASANFGYTADPQAHSPNTKNFTNDTLVSDLITQPFNPLRPLLAFSESYLKLFVASTGQFAQTAIQGPHYIGPWYVNRDGERVHGVYYDVDVTAGFGFYGWPELDAIQYLVGYAGGGLLCEFPILDDGNLLYGGCLDAFGQSSTAVVPYE